MTEVTADCLDQSLPLGAEQVMQTG